MCVDMRSHRRRSRHHVCRLLRLRPLVSLANTSGLYRFDRGDGFLVGRSTTVFGDYWRVHRTDLRTGEVASALCYRWNHEAIMQSNYASEYRDLYERHWWWRARERVVLAAIERHLKQRGGNILDIGCGDGLFFESLSPYGRAEGVEPDESLISAGSEQASRIFVQPFDEQFQPGKRYQLILMLDVLEHLPDPDGALRHATSLLEPDGTLLITVPAFRSLWTQHDVLNKHFTRYTRNEFIQLASRCEVRVDECRYFYHWLFPLKLAVRAKERCLTTKLTPPQVPSSFVNRLCYGISRAEDAISFGDSLPFGSSLMAACGKLPTSLPHRVR